LAKSGVWERGEVMKKRKIRTQFLRVGGCRGASLTVVLFILSL
jgi:hypothetical protein